MPTVTKSNVIFLDIDGVIYIGAIDDRRHHERLRNNSTQPIKAYPKITEAIPSAEMLESFEDCDLSAALGFSQAALNNVIRLCKEHDAHIVLSSAWRERKTIEQLKALFAIHGMADLIADKTPYDGGRHQRGEEIETWLATAGQHITSFVILDDATFDLKDRFGEERFVECDKLFSSEELYEKASAILKKPYLYHAADITRDWRAMENNDAALTHFQLDLKRMSTLRLSLVWDYPELFDRLWRMLEENPYITHLTLKNLYWAVSEEVFFKRIGTMLEKKRVPLQYLNIAHNNFCTVDALLPLIDGVSTHINQIVLNDNPLTEQSQLAKWIASYPRPLKLDLNLKGASTIFPTYKLEEEIFRALEKNPLVSVDVWEPSVPFRKGHETIRSLMTSGQLTFDGNTSFMSDSRFFPTPAVKRRRESSTSSAVEETCSPRI